MTVASEHLSDQQIKRYRERKLKPAELLAADDHLAVCDVCYGRIDREELRETFKSVEATFHNAASVEFDHLTYEQLAMCVDDKLTEAERDNLNAHLENCSQCETELNELRSVKAKMSAYTDKKQVPAVPPLAYRMRSFLARVAVFASLVLLITTIWLQTRIADLHQQVRFLVSENDKLLADAQAARDLRDQVAQLQQENERLQKDIESGAQIMLALNDGDGRVTLDTKGNLSGLKPSADSYQQAIKSALTTERVKAPLVLAQLTGRSGKLMGGAAGNVSYGLLGPVATVVQSDRPVFRWRAQNGATNYVVTIFGSDAKKIVASEPLSATEWTVTAPLERGRIYTWQVRAVIEGREVVLPPPAAADAKFKVLEQSKIDELERVKQTSGKSHLLLGVLYAEAGLLDEAEREFQALLDANPKSQVAQKLLRSVKAMQLRLVVSGSHRKN